jgi:hypothetical protein
LEKTLLHAPKIPRQFTAIARNTRTFVHIMIDKPHRVQDQ